MASANKPDPGIRRGRPPREAVYDRLDIQVGELRERLGGLWDVAPHPQARDDERPGSFRRHDIQSFPGGMTPPSFPDVAQLISSWLAEVAELPHADSHVFPERLAKLHADFERIHPFLDGNGRTGRLILNLILVRLGYAPAIIYKRERAQYLRALRRSDAGAHGALGELLARAILDNLYKFVVPAIAGPAKLVPLPALADDVLSIDALRVAAARGRLEASKGADGTWRSSRAWVNAYKASRTKQGRPPATKPASGSETDPQQIELLPPD